MHILTCPRPHPSPHYLFVRSPSTETPYLGKRIIPPISGIGYHWQLKKQKTFPGFLEEIFPRLWTKKYPPPPHPFSEKIGIRMRPPYAFEGGGGGRACPLFLFLLKNVGDFDRPSSFFIPCRGGAAGIVFVVVAVFMRHLSVVQLEVSRGFIIITYSITLPNKFRSDILIYRVQFIYTSTKTLYKIIML